MDRKTAEEILALINAQIDQLIASLEPVEARVSAEDFAAYKRGVARVITAYDTELIERVTREHPDLRPADDDPDPAAPEAPPPRSSRN